MVEAVEDVLISKSSSPLIQQSFFKRAWSLLNKSNQKKPNKRKRKEEKVDIVVKAQLRESFKELYLEYSMKKDGYRAMIPVPVIIRP